jgi:hypothetical protein
MKAVFIAFEQSLEERILTILSHSNIRGYTLWQEVLGAGTTTGDPHMGSHSWSQKNSSILVVIEEEKVEPLLRRLDTLNEKKPLLGIRAFVWDAAVGL